MKDRINFNYSVIEGSFSPEPEIATVHYPFDYSGEDVGVHNLGLTLYNSPIFRLGRVERAIGLARSLSQYAGRTGAILPVDDDIGFTISVWVNTTTNGSGDTWQRVFDHHSSSTNYLFLTTRNWFTGTPMVGLHTGSSEQVVTSNVSITASAWTHFAFVKKGNLGILYQNGVEVGRNTGMSNLVKNMGTCNLWIGRSAFAGDPYFNGGVDDFRIYDVDLTPTQIEAIALNTPPAPSVIAFNGSNPQGEFSHSGFHWWGPAFEWYRMGQATFQLSVDGAVGHTGTSSSRTLTIRTGSHSGPVVFGPHNQAHGPWEFPVEAGVTYYWTGTGDNATMNYYRLTS
jgi:hypothetical protein